MVCHNNNLLSIYIIVAGEEHSESLENAGKNFVYNFFVDVMSPSLIATKTQCTSSTEATTASTDTQILMACIYFYTYFANVHACALAQ